MEFEEFFPFQISFPGGMWGFFSNPGLHTNKISSEDVENGSDLGYELFFGVSFQKLGQKFIDYSQNHFSLCLYLCGFCRVGNHLRMFNPPPLLPAPQG